MTAMLFVINDDCIARQAIAAMLSVCAISAGKLGIVMLNPSIGIQLLLTHAWVADIHRSFQTGALPHGAHLWS